LTSSQSLAVLFEPSKDPRADFLRLLGASLRLGFADRIRHFLECVGTAVEANEELCMPIASAVLRKGHVPSIVAPLHQADGHNLLMSVFDAAAFLAGRYVQLATRAVVVPGNFGGRQRRQAEHLVASQGFAIRLYNVANVSRFGVG